MAPRPRQVKSLAPSDIWQSVSLEERLELISKSHASGFLASVVTLFLVGSIAYGLNEIWLLAAAVASAFFSFPLFSSHTWRTGKPSLMLAYLAVRTVARRYAYAFSIVNTDIVLIYKGEIKELFSSTNEEELHKQKQSVDFESLPQEFKPVWIVLMFGGVVFLSEKVGGAKLEYLTPILGDTKISEYKENLSYNEMGCILEGSGVSKGKSIVIKSKYKGAQYVFTKRVEELIFEAVKAQATLENLRKSVG